MGVEKIIVGLGNPGKEYEKSRHNIGFCAVDYIANSFGLIFNINKFKSVCTIFENESNKILILKPNTFMNLSGDAVVAAMNFYKICPENTLLIFDDIYIPFGKVRFRQKGSSGGQNGVKDIIKKSRCEKFPRVKVGVGSKPDKWNLSNWVLSKFTNEEENILQESFKQVFDVVQKNFLK